MENAKPQKPEPQFIGIPRVEASPSIGGVTVWQNYRHAPDWYADAKGEAVEEGHDARRREIIFAVCLAESFIVEWALVDVCGQQMDEWQQFLSDLMAPYNQPSDVSVRVKWKDIPKLARVRLSISGQPNFGGPHGEEWKELIAYRNGLIHALASLPHVADDPEPDTTPTKDDLDGLEPGWALRVVVERIERLHQWSGTPLPDWMDR